MSDLHYLTASEAKELFAKRELSPVELLDAVVARTDKVEGSDQRPDRADAWTRRTRPPASRSSGTPTPTARRGRSKASRCCSRRSSRSPARTIEEGCVLEKGNIADVTHPIVERVFEAGPSCTAAPPRRSSRVRRGRTPISGA